MTSSYEHMPKVFADLMALSNMSLSALFSRVYDNKSIDQIAAEEASRSLGVMGPEDEFASYSDENAVDKAVYQLKNPNALMTPWGPTLEDTEIDMVLMDHPGLEDLMGLSPEEMEVLTRDADSLIDNVGSWLNNFMNDVGDNAMSLGQDIVQTGKDMFDGSMEMLSNTMSQTLATQEIQSSVHPSNQMLNIADTLFPPSSAYASHMPLVYRDEDGNIVPVEMTTGEEDFFEGGPLNGNEVTPGSPSTSEMLLNLFSNPAASTLGPTFGATDISDPSHPQHERYLTNMHLDRALQPGQPGEDEPGYQPTDQNIWKTTIGIMWPGVLGPDGEQLVTSGNIQDWMDSHPEFESTRPELYSGLLWLVDNMKPGSPYFDDPDTWGPGVTWDMVSSYAWGAGDPDLPKYGVYTKEEEAIVFGEGSPGYVPPDPEDPKTPDITNPAAYAYRSMFSAEIAAEQAEQDEVEKAATEALLRDSPPYAALFKAFVQAVESTPNGSDSRVREGRNRMFDVAYTVFAIHNAAGGEGARSLDAFKRFLDRPAEGDPWDEGDAEGREGYVWTPDLYKGLGRADIAGNNFTEKVENIKRVIKEYYANPAITFEGTDKDIKELFIGEDPTDKNSATTRSGQALRDMFMKLYGTGFNTGFGASKLHDGWGRSIAWKRNQMGDSEGDIFNLATMSPYEKQAAQWSPVPSDRQPRPEGLTREQAGELGTGIRGDGSVIDPADTRRGDLDPLTYHDIVTGSTDPVHEDFYLPKTLNPADMPAATPTQPGPSLQETARGKQYAADNPFMAQVLQNRLDWEKMDQYDAMLDAAEVGGDVPLEAQVPTKPTPQFGREGPAFEGLSRGHLLSMPEPFNESEDAKRMAGRSYQTGFWTGGSRPQWNAMSDEEKKRRRNAGEWKAGTNFVPTERWVPSG